MNRLPGFRAVIVLYFNHPGIARVPGYFLGIILIYFTDPQLCCFMAATAMLSALQAAWYISTTSTDRVPTLPE